MVEGNNVLVVQGVVWDGEASDDGAKVESGSVGEAADEFED